MTDNQLVTIKKAQVMDVFTKQEMIQPLLDKVAEYAKRETYDISTAAGRKNIASVAYKIAQSKTYIENHGKELAAELKALPKKVDATRKHARDFLDALKEEIRRPLDEWEAEQERIKLQEEISQAHEQALLDNVEWHKQQEEKHRKQEAERKEYEERIQREAEARAKAEADERARRDIIEAEARAIAAEAESKRLQEQSKRELAMAEMKAKLQIDEESKRLRAEQEAEKRKKEEEQQRIEAEKRQEDNVRKVHEAIVFDLIMNADLKEVDARNVIAAIEEGKIDNLRIEY